MMANMPQTFAQSLKEHMKEALDWETLPLKTKDLFPGAQWEKESYSLILNWENVDF